MLPVVIKDTDIKFGCRPFHVLPFLRMPPSSTLSKPNEASVRKICVVRLPSACLSDSDVVNMVSVDIVFLQKALRFAHLPWAFPLQLLLSVSFLYSILGMSILQGKKDWKEITWNEGLVKTTCHPNFNGIEWTS